MMSPEVGVSSPPNIWSSVAGSATFSINKTGTYSIYVGNPSSVSVNFDVSYILD